jgi:protein SERAC1
MSEAAFHFVGRDSFGHPNPEAKLDVVFVHGLGGDPVTTWSITNDSEGFWPRWLAVDLSAANVWSAGYDSSLFVGALTGAGSSLHDRSTVLLDFLISKSLGQRPILFVTHSLGGLIVKQMLRTCSDSISAEKKAFLAATRAIVFCGTPHQGSGLASTICSILFLVTSKHVKELSLNEDTLLGLNAWFQNWALESGVVVVPYYEPRKPTVYRSCPRRQPILMSSAVIRSR